MFVRRASRRGLALESEARREPASSTGSSPAPTPISARPAWSPKTAAKGHGGAGMRARPSARPASPTTSSSTPAVSPWSGPRRTAATRSSPRCSVARPTARVARARSFASSAAGISTKTCAKGEDFARRATRRVSRWAATCPPPAEGRTGPSLRGLRALPIPGATERPARAPAHPDREGLGRGREDTSRWSTSRAAKTARASTFAPVSRRGRERRSSAASGGTAISSPIRTLSTTLGCSENPTCRLELNISVSTQA